MPLEGTYSKQGGGRKDDRPASSIHKLSGYAFSDSTQRERCV
jgi:hypothetical protein